MPAAIQAIDNLVAGPAASVSRSAAGRSESARSGSVQGESGSGKQAGPDSFDALVGAATAQPAPQTLPGTPRTRADLSNPARPGNDISGNGEQPASGQQPTPLADGSPAGQTPAIPMIAGQAGLDVSPPASGAVPAAGKGEFAKSMAPGKSIPAAAPTAAAPAPAASGRAAPRSSTAPSNPATGALPVNPGARATPAPSGLPQATSATTEALSAPVAGAAAGAAAAVETATAAPVVPAAERQLAAVATTAAAPATPVVTADPAPPANPASHAAESAAPAGPNSAPIASPASTLTKTAPTRSAPVSTPETHTALAGATQPQTVRPVSTPAPTAPANAAQSNMAQPAVAEVAAAQADPASAPVTAATVTAAAPAPAAETAPAGRFGQARKAQDERDGPVTAARAKPGTVSASGNQGSAKSPTSAAAPATQPSATTPSPQKPETIVLQRDGQSPLPATAAQLPAASSTGSDLFRMPAGTGDASSIGSTDTQAGTLRGEHRSITDTSAGQPPRFSQQTAAQLAGQITQRFNNGSRVFGVRLDPAELGRVDVRLEISHGNKVHATLTAERGDTLAEMQRSSRDLERALSDAGLELGEDGIDFQLGDGNPEQNPAGESQQGKSFNVYGQDAPDSHNLTSEIDDGPVDAYGFLLSRRDGVDLRV